MNANRRQFLRSLGITAGSFLVHGGHEPVRSPNDPHGERASPYPQIGVLLPEPSRHGFAQHFLQGLELGLHGAAANGAEAPRVHTERIDPGAAAEVAAALRRLVHDRQVPLAVATINAAVAGSLGATAEALGVPLIAVDGGAVVPRAGDDSPYILHHTLGHWRASWAMGEWAAGHLGLRAAVAAAFFEAGYDSLYAFCRGFEAAGGEILATRVTHTPRPSDLASEVRALADGNPDFVYALYSGDTAYEFLYTYRHTLGQKPRLVGSPALLDAQRLARLGELAIGIYTPATWTPGLEHAQNRAFISAFAAKFTGPPTPAAVLGYETAQLSGYALEALRRHPGSVGGAGAALEHIRFEGPRGPVHIDPVTREVWAPVHIREVVASGGKLQQRIVGECALPRAGLPTGIAELRAGIRSGWLDPYPPV